ncbi:serine proteinase stubble-like isoform X2 [Daphnia pulex]|uniref:serine proteinase stubble-like isoform X2 n=1 Tax=Daphnia pulex TaxID=6669 RepID=UPI001EE02AF0|nr:serine proteinase stubble-like isoform X2 [Daphnia pulex]
MSPTGRNNHPWLSLATCYLLMASTAILVAAQHEPDRPLDQEQVISDLRQLLDLQFDLTNNGSAEISPVNLMKRMSNLRQLRDPHTMNRLAQMARQRPPPPPPFAIQPGRFNNFRYPPTPSTFMGAPPPPPNFQLPAKQQPDHHPNLYLGVDGHLQSPRNNEQCGTTLQRTDTAQRRIVGGDEAGFGTFPWQAYIRIGSSRCGGSLLNNYYVVTAGHCVARAKAEQVKITLGEYSLNSDVEPLSPVQVGVAEIHVHPYFKFTPQADRYDVAVLRLDRYVPYEPHISPICLPEKGDDFLGEYAWAAGWGAMQAGSRVRPKTLQVVDVPIIDNRQCEDWHSSKGINVIIYDEMMCAGYRNGGKDSCQGDSGGPLMLQQSGRWELVGIVSAGYSCAQNGQPGIYHRVSYTTDWISHIAFS